MRQPALDEGELAYFKDKYKGTGGETVGIPSPDGRYLAILGPVFSSRTPILCPIEPSWHWIPRRVGILRGGKTDRCMACGSTQH
jgi:hypothetical protein